MVDSFRQKRRTVEISTEVNVTYFSKQQTETEEVHANYDEGRVRRPLIIVENGVPKRQSKHFEKIGLGEWTWEDFSGYREAIERTLAINVAPLVGHSVIRLWVMGDAAQSRAATASEIAAMQDLLRACLAAGAVGLSTSFIYVDENLRPVPSRFAHADELDGLARVLAMAVDYFRSFKGVTGVMELQPGQVNWARANPQPEPGAVRMWLWHAFGGGLSFACTYRYRQPLYGSELYHAGIVGPDGVTPSPGGREFARTIAEMKDVRKLYDPAAKMPGRVAARRTAFLWSHDVMWDLEIHKHTALWNTWDHRFKMMAAVKAAGAPLDYVREGEDFSAYPFLVAPAYQLVDEAHRRALPWGRMPPVNSVGVSSMSWLPWSGARWAMW